jgi:hypothetical protein
MELNRAPNAVAGAIQQPPRATTDREERARIAAGIANLGKSWSTLQDTKREILGRPRAGSLRPENKPNPRIRSWAQVMSDAPDPKP